MINVFYVEDVKQCVIKYKQLVFYLELIVDLIQRLELSLILTYVILNVLTVVNV